MSFNKIAKVKCLAGQINACRTGVLHAPLKTLKVAFCSYMRKDTEVSRNHLTIIADLAYVAKGFSNKKYKPTSFHR